MFSSQIIGILSAYLVGNFGAGQQACGDYLSPYKAAEKLLEHRGIAWLLSDDDLTEIRPGDRTWAAEYLTARYATGQDAVEWRLRLRPMPAAAAVAAAHADSGADEAARLAALTLVPAVRAELEILLAELDGTELALMDALKDVDGATFRRIGDALSMSRQGAEQRRSRLEQRVTSTPR
ncbi:hypothetical protein DQ384_39180 [Sphaerisporangium album]|uniref:Uncharacterized protein n=1 Tax=Sphaerisporangium album TaxID=509200 RepID=A0A367ELX0_9ACTN|nr:hypothetical protein [Sphaerisporangium album]RCG18220.1 hypothetical protein DQ384_39180 [Sphaerisporangium album]